MVSASEPQREPTGILEPVFGSRQTDRRAFLKRSGAIAAVLGTAAACTDDGVITPDALAPGRTSLADVSLGSGDIGILNYAFALEQLEAAFYERVVTQPYTGMTGYELRTLSDIRDHEVAHREFLRAALGTAAIPNLGMNFTSVDLSSRDSVLMTAVIFEDLGVAAYNGAGKLLQSGDFLLAAGKIVSVEARHASAVRLLVSTFLRNTGYSRYTAGEGVVNSQGLDRAMMPSEVLAAAGPFFTDRIIATGLPTS